MVVVAIQRQGTDTEYLADVSIRPYTLDAAGRRIMCGQLPEEHDRCQTLPTRLRWHWPSM
jgi:hypothetical protein